MLWLTPVPDLATGRSDIRVIAYRRAGEKQPDMLLYAVHSSLDQQGRSLHRAGCCAAQAAALGRAGHAASGLLDLPVPVHAWRFLVSEDVVQRLISRLALVGGHRCPGLPHERHVPECDNV